MLLNNIKQFLLCCRTDKWHATSIPISTPNIDRTWQSNKKRSWFVIGTSRILFSERRKHRASFVEIHSLRTPFSVSDVKSGPSKFLLSFQGLADNYVCGFCKYALWDCAHFQRSEGITSLCPGITIDIENLTGTDSSQFYFVLIQLPLCIFICINLLPGKHKFHAMIKSQLGVVKSARGIVLSLIRHMRYSEDGGSRKRVPLTHWQAHLFTRINGVIF